MLLIKQLRYLVSNWLKYKLLNPISNDIKQLNKQRG